MSKENSNEIVEEEFKIFLKKFINGEFGLAKTYWIFLFSVNLLIRIFTLLAVYNLSVSLSIFLTIFWFIYQPFALIATARAVKKYEGSKVWAILTKIIIVIAWMSYVLNILELPYKF